MLHRLTYIRLNIRCYKLIQIQCFGNWKNFTGHFWLQDLGGRSPQFKDQYSICRERRVGLFYLYLVCTPQFITPKDKEVQVRARFLYINTKQGLALSRVFLGRLLPSSTSLPASPTEPTNQQGSISQAHDTVKEAQKRVTGEEFVFFKVTSLKMTGQ